MPPIPPISQGLPTKKHLKNASNPTNIPRSPDEKASGIIWGDKYSWARFAVVPGLLRGYYACVGDALHRVKRCSKPMAMIKEVLKHEEEIVKLTKKSDTAVHRIQEYQECGDETVGYNEKELERLEDTVADAEHSKRSLKICRVSFINIVQLRID
jgi:hypothetical protein